tara:strand:- start:391 stop:687 length:297 start_codon:yes stop_codon:yes gene_type:complete
MSGYNPPANTPYCHIPAFLRKEDNKKLIGPKGSNFKRITEMLKLDYIWLDFNKNVIEAYGTEQRLEKAKKYFEKYKDSFFERHCMTNNNTHVMKKQKT